MSLGWFTESAIIPRKAKKVNVDSASFVSLQAILSGKTKGNKQNSKNWSLKNMKEILKKKSEEERVTEEFEEKDNRNNPGLRAKCELYEELRRKRVKNVLYNVDFECRDSESSQEEEKIVIKQPFNYTLTSLEKLKLPEVLEDIKTRKEQHLLLKRKRDQRLQERIEKVNRLKKSKQG